MSRVLSDAITYIPEKLRDKDSYKFFCDLIDFVINNQYISEIDKTEFQFDIESEHFDMSFLMELIGESNFSIFDKNFLNNKSYAYLMSTIDDMKGSIQGLSFALALLGVKVTVYQWWEINRLISEGDTSWGVEPYPEFSIVLDLRLEDISEPLTGDYEKKLKEFARKLMWACVQLLELRIFVSFVDGVKPPLDFFEDLVDSFYIDSLSKSRFYAEHVLDIYDFIEDTCTISASVLVIGEFVIGGFDAVISGVVDDGRVIRDLSEYDTQEYVSEALLQPSVSYDVSLSESGFFDQVDSAVDLCVQSVGFDSILDLKISSSKGAQIGFFRIGQEGVQVSLGNEGVSFFDPFDWDSIFYSKDMVSRCIDLLHSINLDFNFISALGVLSIVDTVLVDLGISFSQDYIDLPVSSIDSVFDSYLDDSIDSVLDSCESFSVESGYESGLTSDKVQDGIQDDFISSSDVSIGSFGGFLIGTFVIGQKGVQVAEHPSVAAVSEYFMYEIEPIIPLTPFNFEAKVGLDFVELSWD